MTPPQPQVTLLPYTTLFRSRIGMPKGSLQEATFNLFKKAGWDFRVSTRSYQPVVDDDELEPEIPTRSEEHTSELQSQSNLVCRLLLEKKKISSVGGRNLYCQ